MRNIHILPTDKTSRLIHNDANQLCYRSNNPFKNDRKWMYRKKFNIYITSDEEIKEGDWYINTFVSERERKPQTHREKRYLINHQKDYRFKYCKKVILTTDQDLIKNGVQAIDDDFLEWFIKNPSCDFVKTEEYISYGVDNWKYLITIPKEESKQETLEEAAERYEPKINKWTIQEIFKDGAKWQQERSYSEEEVLNILYKHTEDLLSGNKLTLGKWFEKFKKK